MDTLSLRSLRTPALLLAALASSAAAQVTSPTPAAQAVHGKLRVARLDADPVTWSDASRQLVLPIGAYVGLEYTLDQPHLVSWDGAEVTELGNFWSRAEFVALQEGGQLVRLVARDPAGPVIERIYENVQVLQPADFAELLAGGEVTESGVLIERGDVDGGDTGSASWSSTWGPWLHSLMKPTGSNPPGMVPGGGPGPGPGGPGPGPIPSCHDSCSINVYAVSYQGNYTWDVSFWLTNHGKCNSSFRLWGTTGSGESTWSSLDLPFSTGSIAKLGGSKNYTISVSYADADWTSVPVGHLYYTISALGSHSPIPTSGGEPYSTCSKIAVDLCFAGCNNP